jgi:hypothetical protein
MPKHRTVAAVALAVMAVVASSVAAASAAPEREASPRSAAAASQPSGGAQEYVVAFQGGATSAEAAISDAGGTVVDVNEDASIALVETTNSSFITGVSGESAVTGAVRNHSIGTERQGMAHQFASERPSTADRRAGGRKGHGGGGSHGGSSRAEPLANLQWDMAQIGATPNGAHRRATGEGVDVGIIDTGIDGSHPDLAPNFDNRRSRNFTMDIPAIDGPC